MLDELIGMVWEGRLIKLSSVELSYSYYNAVKPVLMGVKPCRQ